MPCRDCIVESIKGWVEVFREGLGLKEPQSLIEARQEAEKSRQSLVKTLEEAAEARDKLTKSIERFLAAVEEDK